MMLKATPVPKIHTRRGGFPSLPHSVAVSLKNLTTLIRRQATPMAKIKTEVDTPQISSDLYWWVLGLAWFGMLGRRGKIQQ